MRGVHVTLRMRLFCEVFRNGKPMKGQQYEVLNEVVVDRGANPYLTKIECYEKGRLITKVVLSIMLDARITRVVLVLYMIAGCCMCRNACTKRQR